MRKRIPIGDCHSRWHEGYSGWWQLARCTPWSSVGTSDLQRSSAFQHRGENGHPGGTFTGEGNSPVRWIRFFFRPGSAIGVADRSAFV